MSATLRDGRRDIRVYNEATGFLITSGAAYGQLLDGADERAWQAAIGAGAFLPVPLGQDDSFVVRVLGDEHLTHQEEEEWVGRIEGFLDLPDGQLVLAAGTGWLLGQAPMHAVREVALPPGRYRLHVYACLTTINTGWLQQHPDFQEPLGTWQRRTRPGQPFPDWLRLALVEGWAADPGHEEVWEAWAASSEGEALRNGFWDEEVAWVDFLVQLQRLPEGAPAPDPPALSDGWPAFVVRRPALSPQGLPTEDPWEPGVDAWLEETLGS